MRVLVVSEYFPPDMGGGATRAYNAAKGLVKNGCEVTVVSSFPHYPTGNIPRKYRWRPLSLEFEEGMRILRTLIPPVASQGLINRILLFSSFVISSLFALPFVRKIDVIWAANPNVISFYPSFIYSLVKRCPIVQNLDDLWPETLFDLGLSPRSLIARFGTVMAMIAYKFASALTPISPAYVDVVKSKYGEDRRKIHVVPAGVDLDKFHDLGRKCKDVNSRFRVLYIGAFSPAYNFDQVFDASELLSSRSDIEFVIQGGGELASFLRNKEKNAKSGNVKVIERIVPRESVASILSEADVLLLPLSGAGSIEMGISSKLYEYQAAGRPIVCCSCGQPGRYVTETESGIAVRPGDCEALAESIRTFKRNENIAQRMGTSGRRYVENNLSLEKTGVQMKKVFHSVLSRYQTHDQS